MGAKERIDLIEKRLSALEAHTKAAPASSMQPAAQPLWNTHKRKIRGAVIAVVMMVLAFLGFWYPAHIEHEKEDFNFHVDARIDGKQSAIITRLGEMDTKLTSIASSLDTLKPLIEDLIRRQMEKAASLPQREFRSSLPEIKHLLAAARSQQVKVSPPLVSKVEQKLLNVRPRVPEFWPASAELVSYRSFNGAPAATQQLASIELKNCTDSPPQPMRVAEVLSEQTIRFSRGSYENCRITLDSVEDDARLNSYLREQTPLVTFKHCLIIYRGGAVSLIIGWKDTLETFHIEGHPPFTTKFSGNTLEFENCLFVFSVQGVPPPEGQHLTESLLAQNAATPKLP